jgi:hypothetical protein
MHYIDDVKCTYQGVVDKGGSGCRDNDWKAREREVLAASTRR